MTYVESKFETARRVVVVILMDTQDKTHRAILVITHFNYKG